MSNVVAFTGAAIGKETGHPTVTRLSIAAQKVGSAARLWWRRVRLFMEAVGWLVFAIAVGAAVLA